MSSNQQMYSGYPDNFEEARHEQTRSVLGVLSAGITEMRRITDAAAQGDRRAPLSQLELFSLGCAASPNERPSQSDIDIASMRQTRSELDRRG